MRAAREALFPGVPWQRCQFHLAQNAMAYVPRMSMRREVGEDLRTIFNAADREEADRRLVRTIVNKYREEFEARVKPYHVPVTVGATA